MSKKYTVLNEDGFPVAFYDEEIHGPRLTQVIDPSYVAPELAEDEVAPEPPYIMVDNPSTYIPSNAVEITDEDWKELIENQGCRKYVDGVITIHTPAVNPNDDIAAQINVLEQSITARRMREAILGTDNGWLAGVEAEIEALRAQLT